MSPRPLQDTFDVPVERSGFIIFDRHPNTSIGGQTYYTGSDGDDFWSPDRARAQVFESDASARQAIEECDPCEWLRDRLRVVRV